MSAPRNAEEAGRVAKRLLSRSMRGGSVTVRTECERAARAAAVIWCRWQVGPWQWQQKHIRWFLEHRTTEYSAWTRYRYWLTVERMLRVIKRYDDWAPGLKGPWLSPARETQTTCKRDCHEAPQ